MTTNNTIELKEEKSNEEIYFKKLRNLFFTLYELESELSNAQADEKISIDMDEYEYRSVLIDRIKDINLKISTLISTTNE